MLLPIERLLDAPIMSLQTGAELARIDEPIIDPRTMSVMAFYVKGNLVEETPSVLHVSDIRELSDIGIIIDDSDKLMGTEGLVRLQEIIDFGFILPGIKVSDDRGQKLGKVNDYVIDPETFDVIQIYTEQSLLRSLANASNVIHRSQIVSVTNQQIVVKSAIIPSERSATEAVADAFVNPFRSAPQQQESIEKN